MREIVGHLDLHVTSGGNAEQRLSRIQKKLCSVQVSRNGTVRMKSEVLLLQNSASDLFSNPAVELETEIISLLTVAESVCIFLPTPLK